MFPIPKGFFPFSLTAVATMGILGQCWPLYNDGDSVPYLHNCVAVPHDGMAKAIEEVVIDAPLICPVLIDSGRVDTLSFSVSVYAYASQVRPQTPDSTTFYDALGHKSGAISLSALFITDYDDTTLVSAVPLGVYPAGHAGSVSSPHTNTDSAITQFITVSGTMSHATIPMPYSYLPIASIVAPVSVAALSDFEVSSSVANAAPHPSTTWYVNGTLASYLDDATDFDFSGPPGTVTFKVVYLDSDGDVGADSATTVISEGGGGGSGGGGGGGCIDDRLLRAGRNGAVLRIPRLPTKPIAGDSTSISKEQEPPC